MMKKAIFGLAVAFAFVPFASAAETATGVVFNDADGDGRRSVDEKGIPGVLVSDGEAVVKTDRDGRYRLTIQGDAVIFITKPAGWSTPLDKRNTQKFYYVHCPAGSPKLNYKGVSPTGPLPKQIDFPLRKAQETKRFEALVFGDSQPYTAEQVDFYSHEFVENLIGSKAAFGVSLGDVVGDNLPLHPSLAATTAHIGTRWHYVPGNHDRNYDVKTEEEGYETWKSLYGPTYYSFDEGKAHFVILEDVMRTEGLGYRQGIGKKQLAWLKNDLAATPKDRLVVLMMHIPMIEPVEERKEILQAIAPFKNTLSLGAHWHTQEWGFLGSAEGWPNPEPHRSLVVGTTCGCWWGGELDSVALPMALMSDGTPQGYVVLSVDGTNYKMRYQVSRRPADYQMNVTAPNVLLAAETAGAEVVANVFFGSAKSTVEMRVADGPWVAMVRDASVDPNVARITKLQEEKKLPATGRGIGSDKSSHVWVGKLPALPAGTHLIEVRTIDLFGQKAVGRRIIRVR
jgi:hypothetical protein